MDEKRLKEIDDFLKLQASIIKEKDDFQIVKKSFYGQFMNYGYNTDHPLRLEDFFGKWINRYRKSNHLKVEISPNQKEFLQFHSFDEGKGKECKLYVNFPYDKSEKAVQIIFDFIEKNKFPTHSKVSKICRSDSVVLRMVRIEDAKKVAEFINSNRFLRKNAKVTNPFLMREGIVGYSYDDWESYNSTVCIILVFYFNEKKQANALDTVSLQDFSLFVNRKLNGLRNSKEGIDELLSVDDVRSRTHVFDNVQAQILNYEQMIEMLQMSLSGKTTFQEYLNKVSDYRKLDETKEHIRIKSLMEGKKVLPNNSNDTTIKINNTDSERTLDLFENTKKMFIEYVVYTIKKYGIVDGRNYMKSFLTYRDYNVITRQNGYRNYFLANITPEVAKQIMNYNVDEYYDKITVRIYKNLIDSCINNGIISYENGGRVALNHYLSNLFSTDFYKNLMKVYLNNLGYLGDYEHVLFNLIEEKTLAKVSQEKVSTVKH